MTIREHLLVSGRLRITREIREDGVVIRVFAGSTQALKIDCLQQAPHYHIDPDGANHVYAIRGAPIPWAARVISENLSQLLRAAGHDDAAHEVERGVCHSKLREVAARLGT